MHFRRPDDRLRCLAAGFLLQKYLPGYEEGLLVYGKDGKPFLQGGAAFSLSHGGDFVTLAWCEGARGIGMDVEPIGEMDCYRDMLPFYMTPAEQRATGSSARKAVTIWTRKECLYKCIGEGIGDILELPEVLADCVAFAGSNCQLKSWESEGHLFSLAAAGVLPELHLSTVHL